MVRMGDTLYPAVVRAKYDEGTSFKHAMLYLEYGQDPTWRRDSANKPEMVFNNRMGEIAIDESDAVGDLVGRGTEELEKNPFRRYALLNQDELRDVVADQNNFAEWYQAILNGEDPDLPEPQGNFMEIKDSEFLGEDHWSHEYDTERTIAGALDMWE